MFRIHHRVIAGAAAAWLLAAAPAPAPAQLLEEEPDAVRGIDIVEHPGGSIPLDLVFRDERGGEVRLGDYFTGERPVVLQLGYFRCPMLCGLVLHAMVDGMSDLDWTPVGEYEVLSVSIDPTDSPALANAKKQEMLRALDRPGADEGWHFLTTPRAADVRALADAVGFGYRWDEESDQYAHAAGIFVLTPEGRVSRTLYGIDYPAKTLRLAMVEAAKGKVGTAFDRVLLLCYHYDATSGRYAPAAVKLMKLGGMAMVLVLGVVLLGLWSRDRRHGAAGAGTNGGMPG